MVQYDYTSNGPPEPLIGDRPPGEAVVWTGVRVIVRLAGATVRHDVRDAAPHGATGRGRLATGWTKVH